MNIEDFRDYCLSLPNVTEVTTCCMARRMVTEIVSALIVDIHGMKLRA